MNIPRTAIGGLMLEENEKWAFEVQHGVIVGRRFNDDAGFLCIRHVERNTLPGRLTHEFCLETARQMLSVPNDRMSDRDAQETPYGPFGAATFVGAKVVRRVWYCNRPPGMIVGVYTCPAELAGDTLHAFIRRECSHMMARAVFDRPSWGGDDALTRALLDGLEISERDRPREEGAAGL